MSRKTLGKDNNTSSFAGIPFSVEDFRHQLVQWFLREGKDYPWRRTKDPWAILVSEIMLQQTTVPTILNRYEKWLAQFPTPEALAQADEETVLRSWEGLGYYQRVRNLRKTAIALTENYGGVMPSTLEALRTLPGIGPYTASAVASFSFDLPAPLVDANVSRVFSRLFDDPTPVDSTEGMRRTTERAEVLLDHAHPHAYNSGLMELGQNYCKKQPECLLCPVRSCCTTQRAAELPVKLPKREIVLVTEYALFARNEKGDVLLARTAGGRRREGLWRLPHREESLLVTGTFLFTHRFNITHHKVTQHLYALPSSAISLLPGEEWVSIDALEARPMPSPDRKALNKIVQNK